MTAEQQAHKDIKNNTLMDARQAHYGAFTDFYTVGVSRLFTSQ